MDNKRIRRIILKSILLVLIILVLILSLKDKNDSRKSSFFSNLEEIVWNNIRGQMIKTYIPLFASGDSDINGRQNVKSYLLSGFPVLTYYIEEQQLTRQTESQSTVEKLLLAEARDEEYIIDRPELDMNEETDGFLTVGADLAKEFEKENGIKNLDEDNMEANILDEENRDEEDEEEQSSDPGTQEIVSSIFQKNEKKQKEIQWDYYQDFDHLIQDFYAVDSTTSVTEEQLNIEKMLEQDMSIIQTNDSPQILIYHTHSQEAFADSIPGDMSTTVMGAGEELARILREEYGFNVLHHEGMYDVESRDESYSNALPEIERVLAENPTIELVIDLHRDAMLEHTRLVTEINGRPTAKFMFFNGLSYTNKLGKIDYLENPYIENQLALSFQLQVLANEYYPGLARKVYLKGYRYNMHLCPKTLLIELGAQNNTMEEIWNALDPMAHILAMELGN